MIYDRINDKALFGRLEKERREVASLTKMLTLYTALSLIDKMKLSTETQILIDDDVAQVTGTSANLLAGDKLTVD